ncbi:MAG: hypothetical protein Q7T25_13255 [Sideroxyarcus sp.]|nr:hypothetical protein [Sideroxyarcus sp.]
MNKDQLKKLEADLWSAADKPRANSDLKSSEYSIPVLGLIFLKSDATRQRSTPNVDLRIECELSRASCSVQLARNGRSGESQLASIRDQPYVNDLLLDRSASSANKERWCHATL